MTATRERASRRRRSTVAVIVATLSVVAAVGVITVSTVADRLPGLSSILPGARPDFPAIDPTLSPVRARIVTVVGEQYRRNPAGTTYSDGVREPWCADFVSWTMREAGVPLSNPNSGSWRIPGVLTLTAHLSDTGRLRPPGHRPTPGDIVLYDKPSPMGQHTNIVVRVDGDEITTVGGNEGGGVTLRSYQLRSDPGIRGYGVPGR